MGLLSLFKRSAVSEVDAGQVYIAVVAQARSPAFYNALGVPDTLDGRFDMIIMHLMLVMRRLRGKDAKAEALSQELLNYMFQDMDRSLREIGIGDMSIGKHVKKMAKAFYGRAEEYEKGMDGDEATLEAALKQNLYRGVSPSADHLVGIARYMKSSDQSLRACAFNDVMQGRFVWASVGA